MDRLDLFELEISLHRVMKRALSQTKEAILTHPSSDIQGVLHASLEHELSIVSSTLEEEFVDQVPPPTPVQQPPTTPKKLREGPFRLGHPMNPGFTYDDGFLGEVPEIGYTPQPRDPEFSDRASYVWWGFKLAGSNLIRWDLGNANRAYYHFRNGEGEDYSFDLEDYFDDDESGQAMLENAKKIARRSARGLLDTDGSIEMTSDGFSVGSGTDARFPYPDTEDWQKAVGAFNFWMSADVSAEDEDGIITYTLTLTLHAEDRYNFNPGMEDIATGTPDSANGNFELTGLGHQFMQYGEYTETITWTEQSKYTSPPPASQGNNAQSTVTKKR